MNFLYMPMSEAFHMKYLLVHILMKIRKNYNPLLTIIITIDSECDKKVELLFW